MTGFASPLHSQRSIETVSPEESTAAIITTLRMYGGMPAAECERAVAKLFGHQRPREPVRQRIRQCIDTALAHGRLSLSVDQLITPSL